MNVAGKQVLLAGASGGIGQAIALKLDQAGAQLSLLGRNRDTLETLNANLGGHHRLLAADIGTAAGRDTIFAHALDHGLDAVVMAVGVQSFGLFDQQHVEFFERLVNRLDDPADQRAVIHSARVFYRLYADVFRSIDRAQARALAA